MEAERFTSTNHHQCDFVWFHFGRFFGCSRFFWELRLRVPPLQKGLSILEICLRSKTHRITQFNHWLMAGGEAQHASLPEVRTWRGGAMEEMKRTLSKFQSKGHFVWREFHLKKESFQSFYASFLGMNIVTSWLNVEVRGVLFFGFHMANNGWHLDGRPSTRCSRRRTWAKHWRTLSWCISTGKQWFALHISGHPLLLSLELLFGWFGKMVWKMPKWRFFVVRFVCVLRQEQRSKLHHCCCQRAWGQRFAFQKPHTGNIRSFLHSEKSHFQGVWGALCFFLMDFERFNFYAVHVSSISILTA